MANQTTPSPTDLVGMQLIDGWKIIDIVPHASNTGVASGTGGFFSQGYIAEKGNKSAFVKVIDVGKALAGSPNVMATMQHISEDFVFECTILEACKSARMDRIVEVLGSGQIQPPANWMPLPVPYIIFERADGDLRREVRKVNAIDAAWRLKVLHHVAVGIQQLHGQQIAHQDIKPSNVLLFETEKNGAKIGDLGRAASAKVKANHDTFTIPGHSSYAPPEQVYGVAPQEWVDRKGACDLYQLGAIATFLFSGQTPTQFYLHNLDQNVMPHAWGGAGACTYDAALPVLTATFARFVKTVEPCFPDSIRDEMVKLISNACNPDYKRRGDPASRQKVGRPVGIDTFVSRFNRLSMNVLKP